MLHLIRLRTAQLRRSIRWPRNTPEGHPSLRPVSVPQLFGPPYETGFPIGVQCAPPTKKLMYSRLRKAHRPIQRQYLMTTRRCWPRTASRPRSWKFLEWTGESFVDGAFASTKPNTAPSASSHPRLLHGRIIAESYRTIPPRWRYWHGCRTLEWSRGSPHVAAVVVRCGRIAAK